MEDARGGAWQSSAEWLQGLKTKFASGECIVSVAVGLDHQGHGRELRDPEIAVLVDAIDANVRAKGRSA